MFLRKKQLLTTLFMSVCLLQTPMLMAASDIRTEQVQFKKGTSSAVISSSIKGYEIVDYELRANAGQVMNTSLTTKHSATYFNILAPGENETAMFVGSTSGQQFEGVLPKSGIYKIRVYMMRSAARRNEVASYRLEIIISGKVTQTTSHDAKVAGTPYHATGKIPCTAMSGQPMGTCQFGVKRQGNGNALVTVTHNNGKKRVIIFQNGQATGYDQSQADHPKFSSSKDSDLNIIKIGSERYEIPDAVVYGG